jgi:hypothetical protein
VNVRFPNESSGFDNIVRALVSVLDHADVLALGESHWSKLDSELRIRLVRHPEFAKKVHFIVVEFASTAQQSSASLEEHHADEWGLGVARVCGVFCHCP